MAKVPDYYNVENNYIEEEDGIYLTPQHKIDAALRRIANNPPTTRPKQKLVSRYDENMYALPDVSEGSSPPTPVSVSPQESVEVSVSKEKSRGTNLCIWKCTKRCAIITCTVIGVLSVATLAVTYVVTDFKGNMIGMYRFGNIM